MRDVRSGFDRCFSSAFSGSRVGQPWDTAPGTSPVVRGQEPTGVGSFRPYPSWQHRNNRDELIALSPCEPQNGRQRSKCLLSITSLNSHFHLIQGGRYYHPILEEGTESQRG